MTDELDAAMGRVAPTPTDFGGIDAAMGQSAPQPQAPAPEASLGSVVETGLKQFLPGLKQSLPGQALSEFAGGALRGTAGLTEAGANVLSAFGETIGADEFALSARDYAEGVKKYAESAFPTKAPMRVEDLIANGDAGDYVNFAAKALGEQVPVVASIFAGGGAGVGAGRLANQLLANRLITPAQANALAQRFAVTGGAIGSGLVDLGINTAETLGEQYDANVPTNLSTALSAGAVKSALDVVPVAGFARKLGIGADVAEGLLGSIAKRIDSMGAFKTGFLGGITEMTTEGLQEVVDIAARKFVDENYDSLGPEAISRITNAAATGLLVGGVFGTAAGSMARERSLRPEGVPIDPITSPPLEQAVGEIETFGPAVTGVEVYHGTPHTFTQFDSSKIGTGEGAQAYGHGLYFAENPEVAGAYKQTDTGRVVQARITAAPDQFLLWDKTIDEQSSSVQRALKTFNITLREGQKRAIAEGELPGITGKLLYFNLSDRLGSDQAASEALAAAGIKGVRYLDKGSRAQGKGTSNYVVFSDKDVQMVPEPGSMMAGIVEEAKKEPGAKVPPAPDPAIRQTKAQAKAQLRADITKSLKLDDFAWNEKWLENFWQVAEKNPHIQPLQEQLNAVRDLHEAQRSWIARADERIGEWNSLGKEQAKKLGDFMLDLTTGAYLSPALTKTGKAKVRGGLPVLEDARPPTEEEIHTLAEKHGLSDESLGLYGKVRQDFGAVLDKLQELEVANATKGLEHDPVLTEAAINDIANNYLAFKNGVPYFPLARFGDYTAVVRNKLGQVVDMEAFRTERERDRRAAQLAKEYPSDHTVTKDFYATDEDTVFRGLPPQMLESLRSKLELNEKQRGLLNQALVEASPAKSFRKNMLKRRRVPGFNRDAIRAYGDYFQRVSGFLARLEHGRRIQDAIDAMDQEIADAGVLGPDVPLDKRRKISEFMKHQRNYMFNPANELGQLKSLAFHFWLGAAPDSAFMNLTQVPMVSWPRLSKQFGEVAATRELMSAYRDTRQLYEKGDMSRIPEDEVRAIEEGVVSGRLEENQASDLAAIVEGDNLSRMLPGSPAQKLLRNISHYSSYMFQATEKYNRRVTYRAAYRLAKAKPDSKLVQEFETKNPTEFRRLQERGFTAAEARAVMFAKDTVSHTQFDFSREFRPRFMQGRKGTLFTFYNYTQNMLWHMRYSPGGMRTFILLGLLAGASGLPGSEDIQAVMKLVAKRFFGSDFDPDRWVREQFQDLEMGDYADLFIHGIGRDVAGFDVSKRFGLGRVVPGVSELARLGSGEDPNAALAKVAETAAGAPAAAVLGPLRAALSNDPDAWLRVEKGIPRSLANVSKAMRRAYRGFENTQSGERIAGFDVNDPKQSAELIGTALGFNPARISQRWDRKMQEEEAIRFWQTRQGILMDQLFQAKMVVKDREGTADVMSAIKRYNKSVPFPSLRIGGKEMLESLRTQELTRRKKELGVGGGRRYVPLRRSIQQLHPEDAIDIQDVK